MIRVILVLILFILIARAFWRVVDNVIEAASGKPPRGQGSAPPARGVHMVRDPVCGTFVVPDGTLYLGDGKARVHFCSEACRDKYRKSGGRPGRFEGRTA